MPDNTWNTPYNLRTSACLSLGPSQGIVYQLSDEAMIKVPFQYPVAKSPPIDDANEELYMSLRSFALSKKESAFYSVLAKNCHPNLPQRIQSRKLLGILAGAVAGLEDFGYTHVDLKPDNIGIDSYNQLRFFDYGSVLNKIGEGFAESFADDHFALATCIHYLALGIDPVAKPNGRAEVVQVLSMLKGGQETIDKAAKDFEEVIQAGWTGAISSFSSLRKAVQGMGTYALSQPPDQLLEAHINVDSLMVEDISQWMDEETYRAAWKEMGYEPIKDIGTELSPSSFIRKGTELYQTQASRKTGR